MFAKSLHLPIMDDTTLHTPTANISCNSGYISTGERTVTFQCHDKQFRDAVVLDESGNTLFKFHAKGTFSSWSVRRSLMGADEKHILDVRHYKSGLHEWIAEDPQGKQLCLVKDAAGKITSLQAQVTAEDVIGGHVEVSAQSSDHAGTNTIFKVGDGVVAEMRLMENNDMSFLNWRRLDRSVWKIRIAGGVDLAMIVVLAYCRAEILHAWRR